MSPLTFKEVSVSDLQPNKRNARTHSKKQIEQIAESMRRFGVTSPIVIDENSNILCGMGRWLAAQKLGLLTVSVISKTGLSDAEKRALMLADNKIAQNSGWDRKLLAAELGELAVLLPELNIDLSITGFEAGEIDGLMADFIDPEADPADELPSEPKTGVPVTQPDDLWQLGSHRLLCADACEDQNVQTLMGRDRAAMLIADVPFNVRIGNTVGRGKTKYREFAAASGEMTEGQYVAFLKKWMSLAAKYSASPSLHYVFSDWRHIDQLLLAGKEVHAELKNLVVWAKTNAGQGSFYRSQHELIAVFKSGEGTARNNIELGRHGRNRSNLWTYAGVNTFRTGRQADLAVHPTVKPVALIADAMRDCSRRGDIVLDPFIGSGTAILAAERVGRRGYGLEIDPLYVDVAIRRWQTFTGRDAVLQASGKTFDEVTAERRAPARRRSL